MADPTRHPHFHKGMASGQEQIAAQIEANIDELDNWELIGNDGADHFLWKHKVSGSRRRTLWTGKPLSTMSEKEIAAIDPQPERLWALGDPGTFPE